MVLGVRRWLVALLVGVLVLLAVVPAAEAGLKDDRYDGNIFALYAGNGSLVPPRVTLADALGRPDRATVLVLYLDDSQDCK
ncbi:MAG: thioredoxin family protein, partial [Gloeomargaritaceae cyanobacterium C42_A2020_066]|nr:thioredoxin family protein [Gloeomargaritaceae cyanobacterium C42_A2020_066]